MVFHHYGFILDCVIFCHIGTTQGTIASVNSFMCPQGCSRFSIILLPSRQQKGPIIGANISEFFICFFKNVFTSRAAAESNRAFRWTCWEGNVCLLINSLDLLGRGRLSIFLPYLPIFVVDKSIYWFYCFLCCFNG